MDAVSEDTKVDEQSEMEDDSQWQSFVPENLQLNLSKITRQIKKTFH